MEYYVYILTNKKRAVLYTGVTNNLERRTLEHIYKLDKTGFAEAYNCDILVYFEQTNDVKIAIEREKQIKKYKRQKKIELINEFNPTWKNLFVLWKNVLGSVYNVEIPTSKNCKQFLSSGWQ